MISRLRRRHRYWTPLFLGVIPAVVLIGAVAGRGDAPATSSLPAAIAENGAEILERTSLGQIWEGIGLEVSLGRSQEERRLVVEISDVPLKPDLLLFWSPVSAEVRSTPESEGHTVRAADGGQVPAGSVFLGVLRETNPAVFALPERTRADAGRLVLYSLPYRQVVSVSSPVHLD